MPRSVTLSLLISLLSLSQVTANTCEKLEEQTKDLFSANSPSNCLCTEEATAIDYTCNFSKVCLKAGGDNTEAFSGSVKATVEVTGLDEPSYAQRTTLTLCFQYDELYDGREVCHETVPDTLGGLGTCSIKVDGSLCELCEFCPGRDDNYDLRSVFDCENVGAEEGRVCTSDYANNTETLLRFLAQTEESTECPNMGVDANGSSDGSSGVGSRGAAVLTSVFMGTLLLVQCMFSGHWLP